MDDLLVSDKDSVQELYDPIPGKAFTPNKPIFPTSSFDPDSHVVIPKTFLNELKILLLDDQIIQHSQSASLKIYPIIRQLEKYSRQ